MTFALKAEIVTHLYNFECTYFLLGSLWFLHQSILHTPRWQILTKVLTGKWADTHIPNFVVATAMFLSSHRDLVIQLNDRRLWENITSFFFFISFNLTSRKNTMFPCRLDGGAQVSNWCQGHHFVLHICRHELARCNARHPLRRW